MKEKSQRLESYFQQQQLSLKPLPNCFGSSCRAGATPSSSLPRPKTGAPTCVMAIKQLRCYIDNLSGFVFGIEYAYGNNKYRQICTGLGNNAPPEGTKNTKYVQRQDMQMLDAQGIVKVDVMALAGTPVSNLERITAADARRGKIPAIVFTKFDKTTGDYFISVCGNNELYESGQLKVASTFVNPTGEEYYLGSMQGDCYARNLFSDPNKPLFFVKKIKELCWAPYYHPLEAPPGPDPEPHQPRRPYEDHIEPCIPSKGDKTNKKGECNESFPSVISAITPPAPKKAPGIGR